MSPSPHPPRNVAESEFALARELQSYLGLSPDRSMTWLRVAQLSLKHLQWDEIQRALADHLPPHESVLGAVNNLRQVNRGNEDLLGNMKRNFGILFEAYVTFTSDCDCSKWSLERERQMKEFKRLIDVWQIELPEKVKELL
jgi:hypothetical protein